MLAKRLVFGLLLGIFVTGVGCNRAPSDQNDKTIEGIRKRRLAHAPTFPKVKWDAFHTVWQQGYRPVDDRDTKTLEKKTGDVLIRVTAECQPSGSICSVRCELETPANIADEKIQAIAKSVIDQLAEGLGLKLDDSFAEHARFALYLVGADRGYSFYAEPAFISVQRPPHVPDGGGGGGSDMMAAMMSKKGKWGAKKKGPPAKKPSPKKQKSQEKETGQQKKKLNKIRIQAIPIKYASKSHYPPLPGSSEQQLKQLLDGFEEKARIGNEEVACERRADGYRQVVHYRLGEGGTICWVESFVCDVPPKTDREKIMMPVWLKLAQLKVDGCDPQAVEDFLKSKKNTYGGIVSKAFGPVTWCLEDVGGHLGRAQIWGNLDSAPKKKAARAK